MRIIIYTQLEKKKTDKQYLKRYASSIGGGIKKLILVKKEDEEIKTDINIITTGKVINEDGIVTYEHF